MNSPDTLRIALYQCEPRPLDIAGNLARLEAQAAQAAEQGAAVLVLPEMFMTGYNIGAEAVQRLAEPADGAMAERAGAIARKRGIALCYGYPERGENGHVFNSAQLLDANGQPLLNYRKRQLFGVLDREQFSEGDALEQVAQLAGWSVGLQICYDIEFPEGTRRLAQAGAELVLVPTANMAGFEFVAQVTVRARAWESACFVAYANFTGKENGLAYCGLSSVNGPSGSRIEGSAANEELMLTTVNRPELTKSRRENPYLTDLRTESRSESS
ncbi:carbon-nitrogen hydrolase family protein [Pseudomonas sp. KNUC1026]|uniref:carbon-nitrogen hydrolase family protein n=1 Tax=Pseudomonas sp. KNUC1026 TaxID=2893890 RepID=UPI001F25C73B|nr:carbon-nitrogen hydrolase family protein [Pseudomonas sp. KNUC1026]UFH49808.1 carbon-nitrogen hydrolase family protein [Pseudomonas sp. KNUC1026]